MEEITLKFLIKLKKGMALISLTVHTTTLKKPELDKFIKADDPNTIDGEIKIQTTTKKVTFDIRGVGDITAVNTKGTFNFTLNDNKIFKDDQDLLVNQDGRIEYFKSNVVIPIQI
jgi:hypothetical protein